MARSTSATPSSVPAWLPARFAAGGAATWTAVLAAGVLLGVAALIPPALLSDADAFNLLAVLVAMISGVYLGFALVDGRLRAAAIEELGIVLFAVLAVVALSTRDARWLAGGLLGHAAWDAIHHPRAIDTAVPWWYVPLCIGFDVVVGAYALIRF